MSDDLPADEGEQDEEVSEAEDALAREWGLKL